MFEPAGAVSSGLLEDHLFLSVAYKFATLTLLLSYLFNQQLYILVAFGIVGDSIDNVSNFLVSFFSGGYAGMAETGELIGAEDYFLSNCRDYPTSEKFLSLVQRYHII